jgi:hypothetical protein
MSVLEEGLSMEVISADRGCKILQLKLQWAYVNNGYNIRKWSPLRGGVLFSS